MIREIVEAENEGILTKGEAREAALRYLERSGYLVDHTYSRDVNDGFTISSGDIAVT